MRHYQTTDPETGSHQNSAVFARNRKTNDPETGSHQNSAVFGRKTKINDPETGSHQNSAFFANKTKTTDPEMTSSIESLRHVITELLATTLHIKSFSTRWHAIRSHLLSLSSSLLPSVSASPHHSSHPLLTHTLLPSLANTLSRIQTLSSLCSDTTRLNPKLLMQSDLDMAIGWLAKQTNDLDLLLRSGVLNHSNAIVLAPPTPESTRDDVACFVRDLFARLQIGGAGFKKKSLESLVLLLEENEKSIALVSEEGNIGYLVNLVDLNGNDWVILDLAVNVVSALACGGDTSRRRVFNEGGLGPLLRVMESGPLAVRERAAAAVEAISADADSVWALSAYGGLQTLVRACAAGSPAVQAHAAGAMKNAAGAREDARAVLTEAGAAPVLLQCLAAPAARQKAAECIAVMTSSDESFRESVMRENGLACFLDVIRDVRQDVTEHVLRAVHALSVSDHECRRGLASSAAFVAILSETIAQGNNSVPSQRIACSILSTLSLTDSTKRAAAGCVPALLKLMEFSKPDGIQDAAYTALVSLLTVGSIKKGLAKDEKCVVRLVSMLDPRQDTVPKEMAVAVLAAVLAGGSEGCRRRVAEVGAHPHLVKLTENGVVGAKKAVQKLNGNRFKSLFSRTWRELPGK